MRRQTGISEFWMVRWMMLTVAMFAMQRQQSTTTSWSRKVRACCCRLKWIRGVLVAATSTVASRHNTWNKNLKIPLTQVMYSDTVAARGSGFSKIFNL